MTTGEKSLAQAAFKAGWVAACMRIADEIERHGGADLAPFFRDIAKRPDPVEIGDLSTPEGQAMREGAEVVYLERAGKESSP